MCQPFLIVLAAQYRTVSDVADLFYGIKAYQVGKGKPPQTEEVRTTKPYTSSQQKNERFFPFYYGKHIGRYALLWNRDNWLHYGPWLAEPRKPEKFIGEKILIRKIVADTLLAAYVPQPSYCNTLLYVLKIHAGCELSYRYLLGILNSRFIGWYFRNKFQISATDTFSQIMIRDIQQLPIPVVSPEDQAPIVALVDQILSVRNADPKADTSNLEAQVEELVKGLYGLTEEEVAVVEDNSI